MTLHRQCDERKSQMRLQKIRIIVPTVLAKVSCASLPLLCELLQMLPACIRPLAATTCCNLRRWTWIVCSARIQRQTKLATTRTDRCMPNHVYTIKLTKPDHALGKTCPFRYVSAMLHIENDVHSIWFSLLGLPHAYMNQPAFLDNKGFRFAVQGHQPQRCLPRLFLLRPHIEVHKIMSTHIS